jgi:phosphate transport system permease protein
MTNIEKKLKKLSIRPRAYKKLMKRKRIYSKAQKTMARRHAKENRLKAYGIMAIAISFIFLLSLLYNIISNGYSAFWQTKIKVTISFTQDMVDTSNYMAAVRESLTNSFPEATSRKDKMDLFSLVSKIAPHQIQKKAPDNIGKTLDLWVTASSNVDMYIKGKIDVNTDEHLRVINDKQIALIEKLKENGKIKKSFNTIFFTSGDSREAEAAGVLGSLVGSIFVIMVCMLFALPLGVMTAIYLEEFAPKNRLTEFIEVNISNLAAVPSIVFGLLGLAVYIQFLGFPRSAPIAGGLTLALMALPVIVIATRTSIKAIPQSIRDGAMALGASKVQTTLHHVLPLATPGIMTGTILSISRVLGETAPLLMIGMVAFIVDIPKSWNDPSSAMPVQIYLWADSAEMGFAEKTSAAIIILLLFLIIANAFAIYLRKKFEIRW